MASYLDRVLPFAVPAPNIDLDLDIFVHDEFDEYMSDVEFARVAQANRFNFLRFSMLAITAHREVQRQLELTTASD